jgi:hypothetical protein
MSSNASLIDQYRVQFADYAKGGLDEFLQTVENEARRLAPVRKVFARGGGRRKTAWRNVYEARAVSKAGAVLAYAEQFKFARAEHMQRIRVRPAGRGRFVVQVRSFRNDEPYSSEARRTWAEADLNNLRKGPDGSNEPFITVGRKDYVFADFDKLNYEGRRALSRGAARYKPGGFGEFYTGDQGMVAVGTKTAPHLPHVETAELGAKAKFNQQYSLQLGGGLRKSIEMEEPVILGSRITGSVAANAPYALYVEFGTTKHGKAQPYLRPALMRYRYLLAKSVGSNIRNREAS